MKRFFRVTLWTVKLAIVVALLVWLYALPGKVEIAWQDYNVSTATGTAAVLAMLALLSFAWVFYVWRRLVAWPDSFRQQRKMNKLESGYAALQKGLLALQLHDTTGAARQAKQAVQLLPDQAFSYFLAAEVAKQQNNLSIAEHYLQQAQNLPDGNALGLVGLLNIALSQHNKPQALHYARQLHHSMGLTPFIVDTLSALETEQGHLVQAEKILRQGLQTRHLQTPENAQRWRNALSNVLLRLSDDALNRQDYPAALECARDALKWQPANSDAAQQTALLWQQNTYKRKARKTIAKAYELNPKPELVQVWLQLHGNPGPMDQIAVVERLTREHPDHPVSDLAMADANRRAGLWGVARRHAMTALEREPSRAVYETLAAIEEGDNGDAGKIRHWQDLAKQFKA